MRKIKFRIWDKKYKTFDYNASPELFISTEGEVYEKDERTYAMQTHTDYNKSLDYELSQFTGLMNIHNKEIYEGDVLKDDGNFKWIVRFKQGSFVGECNHLMTEQPLKTINLYCAVIGNIYETPSLLEEIE